MDSEKTLRQKTIAGFTWSFADNFAGYLIQFVIGIILARLLTPGEYGLIGMITIFTAVSQSFIDSGFSQALIQKSDCDQKDYSTVFFYNLFISVIFYFVLFFSSHSISNYFNEPLLSDLLRVLSISLIVNAFGLVQRTILTKNINFKLQTKISIISSLISGFIAIIMAVEGFGVWSLVAKTLIQNIIQVLLFWILNRWIPEFTFSFTAFRKMFGFGSKLLFAGLLDTIYNNIYFLIIGKYFSSVELGYYTRADQFNKLPSQNITGVVQRVSFPVLASIQNDEEQLKRAYRKLIRSLMYITFIAMLGMAAVSKPMILLLVGIKWLPSVPYLQLLCFVGMLYPLHAINLNMLNVKGRSDLFLRLEIIKKILAIPVILIGIIIGIKAMIIGMILLSFLAYFLNAYYSGSLIGYSIKDQILDILPSFWIALVMAVSVWMISFLISAPFALLSIQIIAGAAIVIVISRLFHIKEYIEIKQFIFEKIIRTKNRFILNAK